MITQRIDSTAGLDEAIYADYEFDGMDELGAVMKGAADGSLAMTSSVDLVAKRERLRIHRDIPTAAVVKKTKFGTQPAGASRAASAVSDLGDGLNELGAVMRGAADGSLAIASGGRSLVERRERLRTHRNLSTVVIVKKGNSRQPGSRSKNRKGGPRVPCGDFRIPQGRGHHLRKLHAEIAKLMRGVRELRGRDRVMNGCKKVLSDEFIPDLV